MTAAEIKEELLENAERLNNWESLAKTLMNAISDENVLSYWRVLARLPSK